MDNNRTIRQCLKHDTIKVIGLGGIGSIVVQFLAQFLHSLKRECTVTLVDGDTYEPRNRERMLFTTLANKAVTRAEELTRAFNGTVHLHPLPRYVTAENIGGIVGEGDLVFVCVDNHATRLLVSKRAEALSNVVLISGGNDGVENGNDGTFGNVQLFVRCQGQNVTNPLTIFHPEIAQPADRVPEQLGCEELITTSAPQLLFTNLAVASAMLNVFYYCLYGEMTYEEVYLNIIKGTMVPVKRKVVEESCLARTTLE